MFQYSRCLIATEAFNAQKTLARVTNVLYQRRSVGTRIVPCVTTVSHGSHGQGRDCDLDFLKVRDCDVTVTGT
jgi:hypothetical protein